MDWYKSLILPIHKKGRRMETTGVTWYASHPSRSRKVCAQDWSQFPTWPVFYSPILYPSETIEHRHMSLRSAICFLMCMGLLIQSILHFFGFASYRKIDQINSFTLPISVWTFEFITNRWCLSWLASFSFVILDGYVESLIVKWI